MGVTHGVADAAFERRASDIRSVVVRAAVGEVSLVTACQEGRRPLPSNDRLQLPYKQRTSFSHLHNRPNNGRRRPQASMYCLLALTDHPGQARENLAARRL